MCNDAQRFSIVVLQFRDPFRAPVGKSHTPTDYSIQLSSITLSYRPGTLHTLIILINRAIIWDSVGQEVPHSHFLVISRAYTLGHVNFIRPARRRARIQPPGQRV